MVFGGQGQMLLQYFHFVNRCMNGCVCRPRRRTVNWPSVPAAILFPLGPKFSPTRATRLSGVLVLGLRLDLNSCSLMFAFNIFSMFKTRLLCSTVQRQLRQGHEDALRELP